MLNKPNAGEGARDENLGVSNTLSKKGEKGSKESSQQEIFFPLQVIAFKMKDVLSSGRA